jgi:hypothetical protein
MDILQIRSEVVFKVASSRASENQCSGFCIKISGEYAIGS